jgi:hypothetical protein
VDSAASPGNERGDRPWFVIGRQEEYAGEQRANLLRFVGIACFYAIELINRYGLQLGFLQMPPVEGVDAKFHTAVTALVVAWAMLGVGVLLCLQNQFFPSWLKYVSTGCDIALLTAILIVADGPQSPLVVGFFLLVALSSVRFSLMLVRFTTGGALLAYLFINGYARWFTERDIVVPRYHQLIMLLALGLTGIVLGQMIRKTRRMAEEYARRLSASGGDQQ